MAIVASPYSNSRTIDYTLPSCRNNTLYSLILNITATVDQRGGRDKGGTGLIRLIRENDTNSRVSAADSGAWRSGVLSDPVLPECFLTRKFFAFRLLHLFLHPHSSSSKMAEVVKKGKSPQDFASQYTFHCYISSFLTVLAMQLIS